MRRLFISLLSIFAFISCSAHGSGVMPAADTTVGATGASIGPAGGVTPEALRGGGTQLLGFGIRAGGPYTGIEAFLTAYTSAQLQISYPVGGSGTSSLSAPMIVPPNKSCLGLSTVYKNSGSGSSSSLVVTNVCTNAVAYTVTIDSTFVSKYVRTGTGGTPQLRSFIYTSDAVPKTTSVWRAFLYNYTTAHFDQVATATGLSTNGNGEAVWQAVFVPGPCPVVPVIAANSVELYNGTSHTYELLAPTMAHTTTYSVNSNTMCFASEPGDPAGYSFALDHPNYSWHVSSIAPKLPAKIFISNAGTNSIRAYTAAGVATTPTITAGLSNPNIMQVDGAGKIYAGNVGTNTITTYTAAGAQTTPTISTGINAPAGIAIDKSGKIYVANQGNNTVTTYTSTGTPTTPTISGLNSPDGVAVDLSGKIYVADSGDGTVRTFTSTGTATTPTITGLNGPLAIAVDGAGKIYVADAGTGSPGTAAVKTFKANGSATIPTIGGLRLPSAVAVDSLGNIYLTQYNLGKLTAYKPNGTPTTPTITSGLSSPSGIGLH